MDAEQVAASLTDRLARYPVVDLGTDEVTARLIDAIVGWAGELGWRVYRRAASVVRLPPPMERQHSVVDVACARPAGPPVVIEVDRAHRQRSVDKLLAEAAAGRVAIWVRWGSGGFPPPPPPVRMVTYPVTTRRNPTGPGRVHSHLPPVARPAPAHSATTAADHVRAVALPVEAWDGRP
jgi:hypothetical protein